MEAFICRFLKYIFKGHSDCIYIEEGSGNESDRLIVSNEYDSVFYPQLEQGTFEGYSFRSFFGASKAVFNFEHLDVVFKIPYNGIYCTYTGEPDFEDIPNHLEIEQKIFNNSNEIIKKFLLENKYLCNYGDIPVYTQKKVEKTQSEDYTHKFNLLEPNEQKYIISVTGDIKKRQRPSIDFLAAVFKILGENFRYFYEELDIEDLHNDNCGYLSNGFPCILDYAGFNTMAYGQWYD